MAIEYLEQLLKEAIGLDVTSVGAATIAQAANERRLACHCATLGDYHQLVRTSTVELQNFIERVVVPETWFFRNREAFEALQRIAQSTAQRADAGLRLLSLPSSTGEEPYSMAMTLFDAGMPPHRFVIDAVDISEQALAHGRNGTYGRNSFREGDLTFRDRYFEASGARFRIASRVRQQVVFRQGNLVSPDLLAGAGVYDVIFCRNVLIYFDTGTQKRAVASLTRLLAPDGYLFIGSSESGILWTEGFTSAKLPKAFAFRRTAADGAPAETAKPRRAGARGRTPAAPSTPSHRPPEKPVPGRGPKPQLTTLDDARRLADRARFAEAARACEEYLRQNPRSADAYCLLGVVQDALGEADKAAAAYRKALYLEPEHGEALVHFALLLEHRGEASLAQALKQRARRVGPRSGA